LESLPKSIKKIGVFVNATLEEIMNIYPLSTSDPLTVSPLTTATNMSVGTLTTDVNYPLDGVQLHGNESPELCLQLKEQNLVVFKAFSVDENFDFAVTEPYKKVVDYFLFDTKATGGHGGHGVAFDWKILDKYDNEIPFLLAGGVSLENIEEVKKLTHLNIYGIDVNSKFEIEPGLKDLEKLRKLQESFA
ncbi:MAG: phosphoribosylanthranilate isomerase, partial [Spirosomaceae bacterium]|nr:phosphoribosylanthranilate isomerase [Spirosomataceae bacterium]